MSVCLFVYLSVCLCVSVCVCVSVCLYVCVSVCLCVAIYILHVGVCMCRPDEWVGLQGWIPSSRR